MRIRVTTSFTPEMWQALDRWGVERGLHTPSEILRAAVADQLAGGGTAGAWRAAYEQVLAEMREEGREIAERVARELRGS